MYHQINQFDKNNQQRIYNLLILKGEALLKGQFLAMKQGVSAGEEQCNFFTAISAQIDTLLIYFINDEISASLEERGPLQKLIKAIKDEHYTDEHFKRLEYAESDLIELFANRTDFIIGSNILDFKISTFSTFEKYTCDLYDKLISINPRSNKKEKKLIGLMDAYLASEQEEARRAILEKIKGLSFYVSSAEKIDYVLSKSELDKLEKHDAREFLSFYRSQRNTIHNMGIHKGKSQSITVKGIEIQLSKDNPSFTENHNSAIFACQELMDIYEKIHASITGEIAF